jgi:PAS domain S-box-containing protein
VGEPHAPPPEGAPPRALADFLRTQREALIGCFTARARAELPAGSLTEGTFVGHLPDFLAAVEQALREGGAPSAPRLASRHGAAALARAYELLRDCLFERLEAERPASTPHELRLLSRCFSAALADGVEHSVEERQDGLGAEHYRLLELFKQAPGFLCFVRGPALVFELANAAYFQLVGHRDILGRPAREALPEVAGQGYFELLERVFTTGEPFVGRAMKLLIQREPGAPLTDAFVDFVYQPIRGADGRVMGILAQGHEVTEVKRQEAQREAVEAALRASEERYRTLFESIDDGFCLMQMILDERGETVDYRFLEANAAFEGQTGLKGAVGRTARELVPDLDPSWFQLYGRVAATGQSAHFENHAPAMGRWFDVYASRVGRPELRQVALVFKDVTARKQVEQERERLLQLEGTAREQAEEASRLRDEFLATLSHELRTPLTAMLGWVQLLRAGRLPPEKHMRALETVERSARAQAQLIDDLLDISRILVGKLRLEVVPLELRSVVEAVLETVRPAADAKDIRLQATLDSLGLVMGDAQRLQQVVWNLLSNAVKFTPRGGRVQVLVARRDSSVDITVSDTGQGIAPEFQPHVFERFRQEDGGSTRMHGGLGLGLSIVRQLVEMHGGTVSVFSAGEGQGTSFTVRLPLAVARRQTVHVPESLQVSMSAAGFSCPPELDGLQLLVVEDETDTREMLVTLLEGCGARVRAAGSVAEALRLLAAERPDVLLSDIGMPEEDGYVLIERLRALPPEAGGDLPAVALTAYARTEDRTRALLSGFSTHVPKPVEPLELLAVIASLARRGRPRGG